MTQTILKIERIKYVYDLPGAIKNVMNTRLSKLLSSIPPKPDYNPVRNAIAEAERPQVQDVLKQFASMPPSTGIFANPVRSCRAVKCGPDEIEVRIRSFGIRGILFEEDIVAGTVDPTGVIAAGLFDRIATRQERAEFSRYLGRSLADSLNNASSLKHLARFMRTFPNAGPDVAAQHSASVRKAAQASGGINPGRRPQDLLAELIQVHLANVAMAAASSFMRSRLRVKPRSSEVALIGSLKSFVSQVRSENPFMTVYGLLLRRAVDSTEAAILDRLGAIQVHHGSAGSNMVARYLASLHTRSVSDFFTAAQMTLDCARHFGAIRDMTEFVADLERLPERKRGDAIRRRMLAGDLPTFGHPEIAAAGRSAALELDPRPFLYLEPLMAALEAGRVSVSPHRLKRMQLVTRMYEIAFVEGITKPGVEGRLRVAPNTDFGAWLVQEALGIDELDRTLLSYVYRGFGWMMDAREQLQQPIIRPVIAPDPSIVPGALQHSRIAETVGVVHEKILSVFANKRVVF